MRLRKTMKALLNAVPPHWREWLPAMVAIVLALCIAMFVWNQRQERLRNDLQADFSFESREVAVRLLERMRAHKQVLRGVRAALSTLGVPDREGWARYVAHHFLEVDFPGMQGFGYAARIPAGEVAVHEGRMRAGGYPDYAMNSLAPQAPSLAPVVRLAPDVEPNRSMVGLDLLSQSGLGPVLETSAAQATTALSAPVALRAAAQDAGPPLFFLVQPIFATAPGAATAPVEGPAPQRNHRDGWVFAVFKAPDLIRATLGELPPHMNLRVFSDRSQDATVTGLSEPPHHRHPRWRRTALEGHHRP